MSLLAVAVEVLVIEIYFLVLKPPSEPLSMQTSEPIGSDNHIII